MEYTEAFLKKAIELYGFKAIKGNLNDLVIPEKYDLILSKNSFHYSKDFEKNYKVINEGLN